MKLINIIEGIAERSKLIQALKDDNEAEAQKALQLLMARATVVPAHEELDLTLSQLGQLKQALKRGNLGAARNILGMKIQSTSQIFHDPNHFDPMQQPYSNFDVIRELNVKEIKIVDDFIRGKYGRYRGADFGWLVGNRNYSKKDYQYLVLLWNNNKKWGEFAAVRLGTGLGLGVSGSGVTGGIEELSGSIYGSLAQFFDSVDEKMDEGGLYEDLVAR